ncbi:MAG: hypothetical protein HY318_08425 [Armatimonadetes bacterium]|nr:hypothetical protein [Armatimonadota bacterium]
MARIRLRLRTGQVIVPEFDNVPVTIIRLVIKVRLQLPDSSFMKTREAIFDTGAPLSMLPKAVWSPLKRKVDTDNAFVGGIARRKVCRVHCAIGTVHGFFLDDEGNQSQTHPLPAFLAHTDRAPLIIGMGGLLPHFRVSSTMPTMRHGWRSDSPCPHGSVRLRKAGFVRLKKGTNVLKAMVPTIEKEKGMDLRGIVLMPVR